MAVIPWGVIISTLPTLVETASKLLKKSNKPPEPIPEVSPDSNPNNNQQQLDAVIKRLEYFESLETEQAKLLQQTIEQLQNISLSCAATAKRANLAIGVAIVSMLATIGTLIFFLG